jgi:hypothetical protein
MSLYATIYIYIYIYCHQEAGQKKRFFENVENFKCFGTTSTKISSREEVKNRLKLGNFHFPDYYSKPKRIKCASKV